MKIPTTMMTESAPLPAVATSFNIPLRGIDFETISLFPTGWIFSVS